MAGNKKPRRVARGRPSVLQRQEAAELRQRDHAERMIRLANAMPFGCAEHRHKIDAIFATLHGYLDQLEHTGESLATVRGDLLLTDADGDQLPVALSMKNQHIMYLILASEFGWGAVPDGLRRFAAKVDVGMPLFASDFADARTTLAWMRAHIEDVTPNQWSAALERVAALEKPGAKELRA